MGKLLTFDIPLKIADMFVTTRVSQLAMSNDVSEEQSVNVRIIVATLLVFHLPTGNDVNELSPLKVSIRYCNESVFQLATFNVTNLAQF